MPVSQQQQDQRGARLLVILFWSGVGLAPLAALFFLVGVHGLAGLLTVTAMVLIGLSITLRRDSDAVRIELQETLLGELDQLRADVREDMATAARNTHRSLTERINALTESVEGLRDHAEGVEAVRIQLQLVRGQVEELQSRPFTAPGPAPAPATRAVAAPPATPGMVRTETVHVTRRTMTVDAADDDARGTVYGSRAAEEPARRPRRYNDDDEGYGGEQFRDGWDGDARWESESGGRWGGGREEWTGDRPRDWDAASEQWTEPERPRESAGGGGRRRRESVESRPRGERPREERPRDVAPERPWEGTAHGDRWAAVRSDENGRELRMGEHRSSVRSDATGTEMRVEDRWAAVRRAEREGTYGAPATWVPPRDADLGPRALPASRGESPQAYIGGDRRAAEPAWERDARGRASRDDHDAAEEGRTARESKLVQAHRDAQAREHRGDHEGGRHESRARPGAAPRSHSRNARDRDGEHEHVGAEYTWSPLQDFGAVDDADDWGPEPAPENWTGSQRVPRQRNAPADDYDRWH